MPTARAAERRLEEEQNPKKRFSFNELVPRHINSDSTVRVLAALHENGRVILNANQLTALLQLRQLTRKRGRIPLHVIMTQEFRRTHAINGLTMNSLFMRKLIWYETEGDLEYLAVDQKVTH